MRSHPLMTLRLSTASTQNVGTGPRGTRRTFPIVGGSFVGDRLRGKVLPGGGDWVLERADGVLELDLRITLETDDGALIHMTFDGIRDDRAKGAPYFRTLPRFETADTNSSFVTRLLAVGAGDMGPDGPGPVSEENLPGTAARPFHNEKARFAVTLSLGGAENSLPRNERVLVQRRAAPRLRSLHRNR